MSSERGKADKNTMPPSDVPDNGDARDDIVLPFQTVTSGINGRLVRLGPAVDEILRQHNYPVPVSRALGQAVAMAALLGASLKFDGKLILQTSTDGPLSLLVVNFETPGKMRGYARFDAERIQQLTGPDGDIPETDLIGKGHLAMTIDPKGEMDRYQGIVAIDGDGLSGAALSYFRQSEQLPTFIRMAVAQHYVATNEHGDDGEQWTWRAGGLFLQNLTKEGGKPIEEKPEVDDEDNHDLPMAGEDDDDWQRVRMLAATVEDHELLDPNLSPERLVYRLFHEEGVRVSPARHIEAECQCSKGQVAKFLQTFEERELSDMRETDGKLTVTCEFCSTKYRFELEELVSKSD